MYAIIYWVTDDYITFWSNADGSIKLFNKVEEADKLANSWIKSDRARVVNLEGVLA